jgi:hypothetical protein
MEKKNIHTKPKRPEKRSKAIRSKNLYKGNFGGALKFQAGKA